ncbi:DEAD/DEAH box helicase [Candidatus Methylomirabilis sp.]|uniref:DEAD/DEAH box helicase n=1 Tax=Candidatus Methylomirabilis sp. TaxID=2032687 RepID=UPI00307661C9
MSFSSFKLNANLLKAVHSMGFKSPTPIQRVAVPPLLEGRDVMASAVTGSGKTAAFLLPILHCLMEKPRGTTRALVLAPTRELAAQISDHLRELAAHTPLKGAAVYGGVSMGPQEQAFRRGVDVLIATPGRLLDHFQYPYARLSGIEHLVLDEADRMLDMGFLPDIRRILQHVPKKRQTLLFSATLPAPIMELARDMLQNPVSLNIERKAAPAAGITHVAYPVPHELKSTLFLELVRTSPSKHVLAFTRTKHRANRLADFLDKHGVTCERIHGNRSQAQRTDALASFKRGRCRVLVATDIAARGIDVEALGLVVNFDVPQLPEDYIHRVGRTGRVDATGDAYTLVSPNEEDTLRAIERAIGTRLPRQKVQGFNYATTPTERFEVPLAERIAAIRTRKAEERVRAKANAARRATQGGIVGSAGNGTAGQTPRSHRVASPSRVAGQPVTGKSFSRPVSGRLNGTADWRNHGSTTETRSARRA